MSEEKEELMQEPLWTKEYIMALVIMFGVSITMNMLFSTIALYGKGLTGSDVFAGTLASAFTIAALGARGVMGMLFRYFSLKQVLLLGMSLSIVSSAGYLISEQQMVLVASRILHGIGFGVASTAAATVVSSSLPKSRLLEGVGYSGMTGILAGAVGPSIALFLCNSDWMQFNQVFYVNLALTVFVFVCALFVKIKTAPAEEETADNNNNANKGGLLGSVVLIFFMLSFAVAISFSPVSALLSVCALERGMGNVGIFFTIDAVSCFLGRLVMPKLVKWLGELRVIRWSLIGMGISIIAMAYTNSLMVLFLLAVPYGVTSGLIGPLCLVQMLNVVPFEKQGSANAMYYASMDAGIGFGALMWSGVAGMAGYEVMYTGAGLVSLVACVVFMLLYKKYVAGAANA